MCLVNTFDIHFILETETLTLMSLIVKVVKAEDVDKMIVAVFLLNSLPVFQTFQGWQLPYSPNIMDYVSKVEPNYGGVTDFAVTIYTKPLK